MQADDEEELLRSVAMQNANSIFLARQRAEQELLRAKEALELKTRELAHSLAMMRATLQSTTDGILVTDERGTVTDFNDRYVDMWRIPRDIMDLRDHRQILAFVSGQFHDSAAFVARVEDIHATFPKESFDVLKLSDGRVFERSSRIQVVNERNVGRVWSFRDVTESRRAEEALRDETRLLELLNRTGTTLASQLALPTLVQSVTDAATELSGALFGAFFYRSADAEVDAFRLYSVSGGRREQGSELGLPTTPLVGVTFRDHRPIRIDDVLGHPRYGRMAVQTDARRGYLPVRSYMAVPVISRSGEVIGGLCFGHPQTGMFGERTERMVVGIAGQAAVAIDNARLYEVAQHAAEERRHLLESERFARIEAERASSMKDEFLATLSHELRTPLGAILGWAHLLRVRRMNEQELHQGLEVIEQNARMQTRLIEDLLDMSRIIAGKMRLDIQSLEPGLFIQAAIETVRPAADAKGITLSKLLDPAAGPVAGDPNRLQQVVWNLLSNAIKFTERNGTVQVLLERVSSHIEITVADTGIGIKPEFLPHVFDRFRQADASTGRTARGLGLGLSIVKHFVELHGGAVKVTSPGEGRGTTFTIELPLMVVHRPVDNLERVHPRGPGAVSFDFRLSDLSGIKVLVVDDQDDARELVKRVLVECRADVITAATPTEALIAVEQGRPDVLVSDIGMPDIDGYELLRRVRALGHARGGTIPAIALTAFARSEDRTRALRAGFLVHVSKPVEPSELVATVASVVGRTGEASME